MNMSYMERMGSHVIRKHPPYVDGYKVYCDHPNKKCNFGNRDLVKFMAVKRAVPSSVINTPNGGFCGKVPFQ